MTNKHLSNIYSSPFNLFIATLCLIFWAEVVVMIIISFLPPLSTMGNALVDATLLSAFACPILYYLLLWPMQSQTIKQKKVEEKLRDYHKELGHLVTERTKKLLKTNKELKNEVRVRMDAEDDLQERIKELEDFYNMSINRELAMKELKEKISALEDELSDLRK